MTPKLLSRVREILEECDILDSPVEKSVSVSEDSFILRNPCNERSILIGEARVGEGREIIAFEINTKKWKWAEDEGFSKDEIIDIFANDIFTITPVDSVTFYLTEV